MPIPREKKGDEKNDIALQIKEGEGRTLNLEGKVA